MKFVHTITKSDVGVRFIKKECRQCGKVTHIIDTSELMGGIKLYDIGKRIANVSRDRIPVYQVENDEQLAQRRKRSHEHHTNRG